MIIEYAQEERRFKNTIQYNEKQRRNNNSENILDFVPNFTDKEFWIYLLSRVHGSCALKYATEELKSDREIVSIAVRNYAYNLEYAADEFKSDHEIVLIAMKKNGYVLQDASVEAPALFNAIAAEAVTKLDDFTPQALANTAWAFATASVEAPTLFNAIADVAITKIKEFTTQGLFITLWSFARDGFYEDKSYLPFVIVFAEQICTISNEEIERRHISQLFDAVDGSRKVQQLKNLRNKIYEIQMYLFDELGKQCRKSKESKSPSLTSS